MENARVCLKCKAHYINAILTTLSVFDAHSVHNIEDFVMIVATVDNVG
jgi:hypothetical protein